MKFNLFIFHSVLCKKAIKLGPVGQVGHIFLNPAHNKIFIQIVKLIQYIFIRAENAPWNVGLMAFKL